MRLLQLAAFLMIINLAFTTYHIPYIASQDNPLMVVLQLMHANIDQLANGMETLKNKLGHLKNELFSAPTCPNKTIDGVYRLKPSQSFISAYCHYDQNDSNGWIVFLRRSSGLLSFSRLWNDYRAGFGDLRGDHWLGLEKLYQITRMGNYELKVVLKSFEEEHMWARYDGFKISDEFDRYRLQLGRFAGGNVENKLNNHNAMKFSTPDNDNDVWDGNCAELYKSGWWFNECHTVNLNGMYRNNTQFDKIIWDGKTLKEAQMMIRIIKSK
ncbi:fibrinogen-like protein 1 [Armigeres subalbatus]|uniref:fibrinogen-like protein 1 n=1 Tax=Armigeres subalbatus TaxID=124917 RepID=UPI002ED43072